MIVVSMYVRLKVIRSFKIISDINTLREKGYKEVNVEYYNNINVISDLFSILVLAGYREGNVWWIYEILSVDSGLTI